jgi:hypothetical protein
MSSTYEHVLTNSCGYTNIVPKIVHKGIHINAKMRMEKMPFAFNM